MVKRVIFIGFIFVFGLFWALEARAQTASGSIGKGAIKRGGSARATIVLDIPRGLHVNSNRPGNEYQIPTTVRLSATGARVGAVSYPRGKTKKFEFADKPINVYEGRVAFTFNVSVPANYKGNTITVRAVVRSQACNDEVCFAPRNQTVTLTARVVS